MDQESFEQAREAAPEAVIIADALHDLADAIRALAAAQAGDASEAEMFPSTLDGE